MSFRVSSNSSLNFSIAGYSWRRGEPGTLAPALRSWRRRLRFQAATGPRAHRRALRIPALARLAIRLARANAEARLPARRSPARPSCAPGLRTFPRRARPASTGRGAPTARGTRCVEDCSRSGRSTIRRASPPRTATDRCLQRASGPAHQPDEDEQDHRAQRGSDDVAAGRGGIEPKARRQNAGNRRPEDADDNIADDTESVALDENPSQPPGDRADDQPGNDGLRLEHGSPPR